MSNDEGANLRHSSFDIRHSPVSYDALLIVSFGGPEGPDEVMPFLENVLRGKNVPRERMLEVAEHYYEFGGVSPINEQNRQLIAALERELAQNGPQLPIYWGNRNWRPMLADTVRQMADDGVKRALAFVTSAYSSYSGCRQYREDIEQAQAEVGPSAPAIDKIRAFFNHPGFIEPMVEAVRRAADSFPREKRSQVTTLFTAHSIPQTMAKGCDYELQLREACRLVADGAGLTQWELTYQSRSGPPTQPWLEPDVCDRIRQLHAAGDLQDLIIAPIGFVSDHLEVLYDLDHQAADVCKELGVTMVRAATPGVHPRFVAMVRELISERVSDEAERKALGVLGVRPDVCPVGCCSYTPTRPEPRPS